MSKFQPAGQIGCLFLILAALAVVPACFAENASPASAVALWKIGGDVVSAASSERPAASGTVLATSLEQLFRMARERNLTLKMERLRAEEQAFDERKAENALIPNLDAVVAHQRQAYVDATPYTMFMGSQYHSNVYSLQLVQRFPGLGKLPRLEREIARMRTDYQNVICSRSVLELERRLVELYFDLVQERELAMIDEENIRLLEKLLEVGKINRDVGLALPNDILRIEAEKANIESTFTTSHFEQENLCIDIATLLDLPGSDLGVKMPVSLVYPLAKPEFQRLQSLMMENDLDLQLARRDCELVRLALDMAQAARKPTLSLNGKYNWTTTSIGQNNARDYSMGLALELPVYDSGDLKNEVLRNERIYERTQLALQHLTSLKRAVLNKAWTDYREMEPKLAYAQKALQQSLENMRMVVIRYQHGDATIVELVDARLTMSLAAQNSVRIHRDERVRLGELYLLCRDEEALKTLDQGAIPVPRVDLLSFMREAQETGNMTVPGLPSLDRPFPEMPSLVAGFAARNTLEQTLAATPLLLKIAGQAIGTVLDQRSGSPATTAVGKPPVAPSGTERRKRIEAMRESLRRRAADPRSKGE